MASERKIRVKFLNLEDPPGRGYDPPAVGFNHEGTRFELHHDKEYELPMSVVRELQTRCKIPLYQHERDPITGELKSTPVVGSHSYRFAFNPVGPAAYEMFEDVNKPEPARKKPGPKPKKEYGQTSEV